MDKMIQFGFQIGFLSGMVVATSVMWIALRIKKSKTKHDKEFQSKLW